MFGFRAIYINKVVAAAQPLGDDTTIKYLIAQLSGNSYSRNTNTVVFDSAPNDTVITVGGNVANSSLNPYSSNWSGYFDGTGDYLSIPRNAAYFPAANTDFTIEAWVYLTATPGATNAQIIGAGEYGTDADWVLNINSSLTLGIYIQSTNITYTGGTVTLNTWTHIAVSRSGTSSNNLKVFVNGVGTSYTTNSTLVGVGNRALTIGADQNGDESNLTGYISNVRIVNGTAVYTSNFTPPASKLSAITNTSFLGLQDGYLTDRSSNNAAITSGGDVKLLPFNPFGRTATSIDGRSSLTSFGRYTIAANANNSIISNTYWTIEAWIYPTSVASGVSGGIISQHDGLSIGQQFNFTLNGSQLFFQWYRTSSTQSTLAASGVLQSGRWQHVAVVRNNTTLTMYVDGVARATSSNDTFYSANITTWIGRNNLGTFPGYISNIRMVAGATASSAVYTADFTPPTSPLTAISGTRLLTGIGNSVTDNSSNALTITADVGSPRVSSRSPFSDGSGYSFYAESSGAGISTAANTAFDLGTGDFTIEAWINLTANTLNYAGICGVAYSSGAKGCGLRFGNNGFGYKFQVFVDSSSTSTCWSTALTQADFMGRWRHVALTRSGGTCRVFVDGVVQAINSGANPGTYPFTSFTDTTSVVTGSYGYLSANTEYLSGYISNARIVKGSALYTSTFTPPTAALTAVSGTSLLVAQDGTWKDNSSNNFTLTRGASMSVREVGPFAVTNTAIGSAFFDGNGDYLSVPTSTRFDFGSGDFTIECWARRTGAGTGDRIIISRGNGANFLLRWNSTGTVQFYLNSVLINSYAYSFPTEQWVHLAVARSGSSCKMFVNGNEVSSTSNSTTIASTANAVLIGGLAASDWFQGYLSNVCLTKGYAKYTSAFTPASAPYGSADALLLEFNNAGFSDSYGMLDYVIAGSPIISTSSFKNGTGSVYFSGSGSNYITSRTNNNLLNFGTGNFTIEMWLNSTNGSNSSRGIVSITSAASISQFGSGTNEGVGIRFATSNVNGRIDFYIGGSATSGTINTTNSTFTHVALCRSGSTVRLFVGGVLSVSATSAANLSGQLLSVGCTAHQGYANEMTGFIDDLKIYNVAKYTSDASFTPS